MYTTLYRICLYYIYIYSIPVPHSRVYPQHTQHNHTTENPSMTATRLQCNHFIKKKNRQCGMTRRKDQEYCTEHLILHKRLVNREVHNGTATATGEHEDRVPCPLDPKHTVQKSRLQKHLLKCNKFKLKHLNDNNIYYRLNYNMVPQQQQDANTNTPPPSLTQVIDILYKYFKLAPPPTIPTQCKLNKYMARTRLTTVSNQKHSIQQSSLIQNLFEYSTCPHPPHLTVLEFGAGRAEFSRYFNQSLPTSPSSSPASHKFILIDRASNRLKFDSKILQDSAPTEVTVERLKIDIKDLYIDPLLLAAPPQPCTIISKHLCGVATDLTLRCIQNNTTLLANLHSICIAMCCRHIVDPQQYINPAYIHSVLDTVETPIEYTDFFNVLIKLTSWATCGKRPHVQDYQPVQIAPNVAITIKERETIGLMARRIIDQGRLQWVQENIPHCKAQLIHYVSKDISLENVALLMSRI